MAGMFDIEGLSDAKSFSDISDSYSTVNEVVREGYSLIIQPEPMTNKKIHFIISSQSWVNIQFKELEGYDGKIEIDLDNSQGIAGVFNNPIYPTIRGGELKKPAGFKLDTGDFCVITAKYTNGTCVVDYQTKGVSVPPVQLPLDVNIKVEFYNQTRQEYNEGESFIISRIDKFPYLVSMTDLGGKLEFYEDVYGSSVRCKQEVWENQFYIEGLRFAEEAKTITVNYQESGSKSQILFKNIIDDSIIHQEERILVKNNRTYMKYPFDESDYEVVGMSINREPYLQDCFFVENSENEHLLWLITLNIDLDEFYEVEILLQPRE